MSLWQANPQSAGAGFWNFAAIVRKDDWIGTRCESCASIGVAHAYGTLRKFAGLRSLCWRAHLSTHGLDQHQLHRVASVESYFFGYGAQCGVLATDARFELRACDRRSYFCVSRCWDGGYQPHGRIVSFGQSRLAGNLGFGAAAFVAG